MEKSPFGIGLFHTILDAIHFKVREDGRVVSKAIYTLLGVDKQGKKVF